MKKTIGVLILLGVWTFLSPGGGVARADDPWAAARFVRSVEKPYAPDFAAMDVAGGKVRLKEFRGKVVMLFFWAGW